MHYLNSLDALNTSNQTILDIVQGKMKDEYPAQRIFLWVDVRDVAMAHVKAMELSEAANKRFFVTAGYFTNREIVNIVRRNFSEYKEKLPSESAKGGDLPEDGVYKYDNSRSREVLGIEYMSLEKSVVDTVKSLKEKGA